MIGLLSDLGEPVVVFCRFRHDLEAVANGCEATRRNYREISGRRNELEAWKKAQNGILGVQIRAGGEGIRLTRARYAVYYSVGHSLAQFLQKRWPRA